MTIIPASNLRDSIDLIKRTVAKGATDLELELFVRQCERTGLDPFARQIYAIKRWDAQVGQEVMQTQVSIDGMRAIAAETKRFAGEDGPFWCGTNGAWVDVWLSKEPPRASKVIVFRERQAGIAKFTGVALWDSYCQRKKDGSPTRMWSQMGPEMLAKCAEALALRKAFPQGLSGLYTSDEMGQATNHDPEPPQRVKSSERPPEARQSDRTPSDDESPILPPPNAAEGKSGASPQTGAAEGVRSAVSGAFGRLTQAQRSSVFQEGQNRQLRLPDDPAFSTQDANSWMEVIAEVKA